MCVISTSGYVSDWGSANGLSQVMITMALAEEVVLDDHFDVALDFLEGAQQHRGGDLGVPGEELAIGAHHPLRSVEQAFATRIVTGPANQGPYGLFGLFLRGRAVHLRDQPGIF